MIDNIEKYFRILRDKINDIDIGSIASAIELIKKKIDSNNKIITCGNGGSANTASHYITDWNKCFNLSTGRSFKGISLCDNTGLVTAYANDLAYDEIFSGQLKNIGEENDLLIVVSGSGNSRNVVEAIKVAKNLGIETLSIVGYDGGECLKCSEYNIHIKSFDMQICEDIHLILGHIIMKNLCNLEVSL